MAIASGVQVRVVSAGSPNDRTVIYGGPLEAQTSSGSASVLWWPQGYVVQGRPAETRRGFWPSATWVCSGFRHEEGAACCLPAALCLCGPGTGRRGLPELVTEDRAAWLVYLKFTERDICGAHKHFA